MEETNLLELIVIKVYNCVNVHVTNGSSHNLIGIEGTKTTSRQMHQALVMEKSKFRCTPWEGDAECISKFINPFCCGAYTQKRASNEFLPRTVVNDVLLLL